MMQQHKCYILPQGIQTQAQFPKQPNVDSSSKYQMETNNPCIRKHILYNEGKHPELV